jgi:hypothetical protein
VDLPNPGAQRLQLIEQGFKRLADSTERRCALLHQLELDAPLAFGCFLPAHESILPYDSDQ